MSIIIYYNVVYVLIDSMLTEDFSYHDSTQLKGFNMYKHVMLCINVIMSEWHYAKCVTKYMAETIHFPVTYNEFQKFIANTGLFKVDYKISIV